VLQLNIVQSPCPAVVLNRYEKGVFPSFDQLFEIPSASSPLFHLARNPQEASVAVVLENRSEKPITGWRFRWEMLDVTGKRRTNTLSNDSYAVDMDRAIAEPGSRHLISTSGSIDETLIEHALSGGGFVTFRSSHSKFPDLVELTFEIQSVLFADGEIAGSDPDRYVLELQSRKPAAEFIARQIRLATAEGRDVSPVLSALVEAPALGSLGRGQGDPLVHWVRHYARDYLRSMHRTIDDVNINEIKLKHLESRPSLPKFYRRQPHSEGSPHSGPDRC
jgi:hypothetical protein